MSKVKGFDPNSVVFGIMGGGILTCLMCWLDDSIGHRYPTIIVQMVLTIISVSLTVTLFDKLNKEK